MSLKISPKIAGIIFGATSGQTHPVKAAAELAREIQDSGAADLRSGVVAFKKSIGAYGKLADLALRILGPEKEEPPPVITVKEVKR